MSTVESQQSSRDVVDAVVGQRSGDTVDEVSFAMFGLVGVVVRMRVGVDAVGGW